MGKVNPDQNQAHFGDIVQFERDGIVLEGKVLPSSCQNSVIVDLTIMDNFEQLELEHERTVVNHKNYQIVS
ncbi:YkvS family protein [Pontibacillus litoralis]|uniref:DUF2187 domain-containing protein n=1 Tax=Pontibacillus litoralis JSM 072002 TaxID=1385512 RepID=A0A0A5G7M3_9BACI|nr:YkvS family protein [Pontibacillus litoralis]KGX87183.1 hypothetical protein N784_16180 [Pontibacillus litoralis JSM 072002]